MRPSSGHEVAGGLVVNVPTVLLPEEANAGVGQVTIGGLGIPMGDAQHLITGER
jgi:hypothetical protein